MGNCIGKTNAPALSTLAPAPSVVSPPAAPAAVLHENFSPMNELPRELKAYIAKLAGPEAKRALRLTNSSFRQAVEESVTRLNISAQEINNLPQVLASLPAVTDVTITGLGANSDAYLAELAQLNPAIRSKIRQLDLSESSLTDNGLARLQSLTHLQSLNFSGCRNLTDAGLVHLQSLTQLRSLDLSLWHRLTGVGLAHLQPLTQLQSLNFSYCHNLTDAGLVHLQSLTQLQSLNLRWCSGLTDAGLRHFPFARR